MEPFDLQRMLIGDAPTLFLVEIAVRTIILYVYAVTLMRLTPRRTVGELSILDLAIVIALGSAVGDPMFYPEVPLLHGMVVIAAVIAVEYGLTLLAARGPKEVSELLAGRPHRLVQAGMLEKTTMKAKNLANSDVFMKLRLAGITHLGEVRVVYVEMNGEFSIFKYPEEEIRPGLPIVPPWPIDKPEQWKPGDTVPASDVYACTDCGRTDELQRGQTFPPCPECPESNRCRAGRRLDVSGEEIV